MQCHILFLALGVLCVFDVNASLVQINDTTFASLPPLYALDDWTRCQNPGDVYCIVDAELVGADDVLDLLKEYSAQTLKHYNRSQIHRGVCVTRCPAQPSDGGTWPSDGGTWERAAQECVNDSLWNEYGLQASLLSVGHCTHAGAQASTSSSRALGVTLLVLGALACAASVLHVISDRCAGAGILHNQYLLSFSLRQNWAILTYDRSKPRQDERMRDLACLEGVRVMAIQCVIFSHVLFMYVYSYTDNPQYIEQMFDNFGWQTVLNSPLWLQAFFALSAFLTSYTLLVCSEKKPFTVLKGAVAIMTRYVRLAPSAMFALWFTISWFPRLGAGPMWGWVAVRESHDCMERWIPHLFMVHNYLPTGKFCMGHTWYIAADMQLHVLGILLLLVFLRHRRLVYPVLATILLGSVVATTLVAYLYDIQPIITAQAPESLRTLFAGSKLISMLYVPSYMNLAGYASGMAVAFILHDNQKNGVKLRENKLFNLLFHLSLTLGSVVVMSGTVFLHDAPPSRTAAALVAGCERALTAVCFSVFMLGAVSRCRSLVRDMFDWRGFHTLGRLSYCAFLIHFIVLRLTLGGDTRMMHVSILACLSQFITASVLTYLAAIPLCLLVELPFTQLWKTLVDGDKPASTPEVGTTQHLDSVKQFDLVAHVRRPEVRVE